MKPNPEADIRAREILSRLPDGPVAGAEIGVFTGELSRRLLERNDLNLLMVDSWAGHGRDYVGESNDAHARLSDEQQRQFRAVAERTVKPFNGRAVILPLPSHVAADKIEDASLDFVFIDADHSHQGCKRDIELWSRKLKAGGLLSGHDYGFADFGVTRAVNEFTTRTGLALELGEQCCWFVRLKETSGDNLPSLHRIMG